MASAPYDPGKPQPVRLVNQNEQLYAVDSFRGQTKSYLINLKQSSCSCPHWQGRLKGTVDENGQPAICKHIRDTRRQARFLKLLTTARALTDSDLARLLGERTATGDFETAGALRVVRAERRQAAAAAAPRPALGTSVKVWGPTTDAEAWALLQAPVAA